MSKTESGRAPKLRRTQSTSKIRAEMHGKAQSVDGHRPSHLPSEGSEPSGHQILAQTRASASPCRSSTAVLAEHARMRTSANQAATGVLLQILVGVVN